MTYHTPKHILPIIVISQFCCTSLWFAGNGVMGDLIQEFSLPDYALGHLTSAVQFGFISGTLAFAIMTIADRFPPSRVFLICALLGSIANLGTLAEFNTLSILISFRFLTGFFLAGIYPVGMKIAADYYEKGLGLSLGYLVGALVVGTAFPHLLKGYSMSFHWSYVLIITSILATTGGLLMQLLVPPGPFRKMAQQFDPQVFVKVFKNSGFRSAAFGYFGHMWELYAFWAFVPVILTTYNLNYAPSRVDVSMYSFAIIGLGGLACVVGGYLSLSFGTKRTAFAALLLSCLCCILSPLILMSGSKILLIGFLAFWGLVVIADSPLFSTLVAQNTHAEAKGTALTITNCIGFAITIISIQLVSYLTNHIDPSKLYLVLAVGPAFGLIALMNKGNAQQH